MKSYLFVNPLSGSFTARRLEYILERLSQQSIVPDVFRVHTPDEIRTCCATINCQESPLVIVAGGDGTINAAVNSLSPGLATLAVIPFGTSNVLASEIGISSIDDAVKRIIAGKTCYLSVGMIEFEGRTLRFLLMAGVGLDGAVVRDVVPMAKRFLRQGAYALSALKNCMAWDNTFFEMKTAEETLQCHSVIICNASRYGGDFVLSPDTSPFISGLSAVCITGNDRLTYLKGLFDLFRGNTESNTALIRRHSSRFEIQGKRPIQIDGDFVGYTPARISELRDFATIIV